MYRPNPTPQETEVKQEPDNEQFKLMQDFMNQDILKNIVTRISQSLETSHVNPEVVSMIALATQERIQKLIKEMIDASKYRVDSQSFTQPIPDENGLYPYKIADILDVKKQLLAVERVEREEERRRREFISERERRANMAEEDREGGDDDKPKKKKKKDQGGAGARYMSDDVRNKSTNETALMIAGGVKKKPFPVSKPPPSPSGPATPPETSPTNPQSPTQYSNPASGPMSPSQESEDQPRGRGRPKRRKSGSGQDVGLGKKPKGFNRDGFFLPPSTIGRPHHRFFGEQGTRKITKMNTKVKEYMHLVPCLNHIRVT
ncbi:hypothetical protein CU098_003537 [Rhizopus stolonifer]|uniref:Transcription initiation factor TFIID subunit 4 n=1 Tax=Rhizopus stolonifer TaxID=4846 RepID=A0A367K5H9_RHIST|nr:hypothetical protein CU098_003537 [Rhizopus stolonifer]